MIRSKPLELEKNIDEEDSCTYVFAKQIDGGNEFFTGYSTSETQNTKEALSMSKSFINLVDPLNPIYPSDITKSTTYTKQKR